jgi:Tfp pilus assembly pilus retraction ATPase PilT
MTQISQEMTIVDILKYAVERSASDIIITAGLPPQFKVHGEYTSGEWSTPFTPNETRRLMYAMMDEKRQRVLKNTATWISRSPWPDMVVFVSILLCSAAALPVSCV